ncbi:unnamed protein product [Amoebophrya sp. A25]|nr:unnamed protein product [Amoebophrya sp. A25]|eukprot:GSA25T00026884001.1
MDDIFNKAFATASGGSGEFDLSATLSSIQNAAAQMVNSQHGTEAVAKALQSSPLLSNLIGTSGSGAPAAASSMAPASLAPSSGGAPGPPQMQLVSNLSAPAADLSAGPSFAEQMSSDGFGASYHEKQQEEVEVRPPETRAARRVDLEAGTEFRVLVDDKLHEPVTVRVCMPDRGTTAGEDISKKTVELFGKELCLEQEYPIMPGSRCGFFTWKGCTLSISGPTVQEFAAANSQMSVYAACAAVIERRRQRALEVGAAAPRVMVCGSDGSGKSVLGETLWHYAIRRGRMPIFVDADCRYTASVSQCLQGLPGCVHATIGDYLEDDKSKRITFFYGHLHWRDNPALYEQVCQRLSMVVNKKLALAVLGNQSDMEQMRGDTRSTGEKGEDSKRVAQSGLILNAPAAPSVDILATLAKQFYIDTIICLDDARLAEELKTAFEADNVDVVLLEKTDGAFLEDQQTLRMQRHQRMRDYFQGVSPISNGFPIGDNGKPKRNFGLTYFSPLTAYHASFPLHQINLLQYGIQLHYRADEHGHIRSIPQLTTSVFDRSRLSELIYTALAVIRATSEEDLQYMQVAGFLLVTGIDLEQGILHVAMPDVPPLPSNYFLVPSDIRNMTFLDALG